MSAIGFGRYLLCLVAFLFNLSLAAFELDSGRIGHGVFSLGIAAYVLSVMHGRK